MIYQQTVILLYILLFDYALKLSFIRFDEALNFIENLSNLKEYSYIQLSSVRVPALWQADKGSF